MRSPGSRPAGGALLNFNYLLAGSASINPVLLVAQLLLILAWRRAGYIGLDRWLLPQIGTPWQPGRFFRRHTPANPVQDTARGHAGRNGHRLLRLPHLRHRQHI